MNDRLHLRFIALFLITAAGVCPPAGAQPYPSKPIRLIMPFPAGAPVDTLTRQIGHEMAGNWGQALVIENRPGANGILSADACAKAPADGYTLCLVDRTTPLLPYLYRKLPFDVAKDFDPVTNMVFTVLALAVHPSIGVSNLKELIGAAKAKPGVLNYSSLGPATTGNLLMEWLKKQHGLAMTHVPYKGPPALMQALLSGESHITYLGLGAFVGFHKSGKLRIIAVSGEKRSPLVPEVATLIEQGLTAIDTRVWFGLFAPAGVQKDRLEKIQKEVFRIFAVPAFREKHLLAQAFEPIASTAEEFARFLSADREAGAELIRISGARLD